MNKDAQVNDSQDPLLLDHEYDGIRELDNKLPRWWVWLFWGCNIFGVVYLCYYHVFATGDIREHGQMKAEYLREMKVGDAIKQRAIAEFEAKMATLEPSTDPAVLAEGRATYTTLCAPCHRDDGGGLVGPNLTDDYWIHGDKFADNLRIIWNGVPDKGMVTWRGVLKPSTIHAVGSYIYTLRGAQLATPGKPREDQAPKDTGPSIFE
ncbi:MAG: cbb3-type cytochrome c oxidase N-terminal domain-containing protein [Limisphaerales bacterium]